MPQVNCIIIFLNLAPQDIYCVKVRHTIHVLVVFSRDKARCRRKCSPFQQKPRIYDPEEVVVASS